MKYALVVDGVIDTVSLEAQAEPWVEIGDDVFAGFVRSGGQWINPDQSAGLDLGAVKIALKETVDVSAEGARRKYITRGAGQALEYWEAAGQAKDLLAALAADPNYVPPAGSYEMLDASIGIDGATIADVARTVAGMYDAWIPIGAAIRNVRLTAKAAIDAAETAEAAQAVLDAIVWP